MSETSNDEYHDMTEQEKAPLDYELPQPPSDAEEEGRSLSTPLAPKVTTELISLKMCAGCVG